MAQVNVFLWLLLLLSMPACRNKETTERIPAPPSVEDIPENLLEPGNMARILEANHRELQGVQGDLNSYRAYLQSLPWGKVSSVVRAKDYVLTCLPEKAPYGDSVFILTRELHLATIDSLNYPIDEDPYYDAAMAFLSGPADQQAMALADNLRMAGILMSEPEGILNYDEDPDFLKALFRGRVSDGTWAFLRSENKGPIAEDAILLVGWNEIYWRVMGWEDFLKSYPDHPFRALGAKRYAAYLEVLLTGMDNTRAFDDYYDDRLDPELKAVFERIMREGQDGPCKDIVTRYYSYVAQHGFRKPDDLWDYVERLDLVRMWGVDPETE